ncbi:MAG: hypothetical protein HXY28_03370 [Hydrogenophilaceae bacterium]|jgi:hypothetical protein|nr:hypothetical protein [Hydrogenophilaceae bacterium]
MKVRDLRRLLKRLANETDERQAIEELAQVVDAALTSAGAHDDMSIQSLIRKLTGADPGARKRPPQPVPAPEPERVSSAVAMLKSAFQDDRAFEHALDEIASARKLTKPMLVQIFYALFNRTTGVPKSATRQELVQLIADERRILVRNERMSDRLRRGKIVPAE